MLGSDPIAIVCKRKLTVLQVMKTMLNIGDYALHKATGKLGQVVAYGHEILDNVYLPTIKVEVVSGTEIDESTFLEDLYNKWEPVEKEEHSKN